MDAMIGTDTGMRSIVFARLSFRIDYEKPDERDGEDRLSSLPRVTVDDALGRLARPGAVLRTNSLATSRMPARVSWCR